MKLSTKGKYGLRALIDLAQYSEDSTGSITRLVKGIRGANGGYVLAKEAKDISVGDVLRALEGNLEPVECAGLDPEGECKGADSCVTKYVWKRINDSINQTVDEIWLNQLVTESKCLGHTDNHLDYTKCKN